jgi:hypothetical protein
VKIRPLYMTGLWSKEFEQQEQSQGGLYIPDSSKEKPTQVRTPPCAPESHHGSTSILACEVRENATLHSLDTTMKNPDRPARRIPSDLGARYELRRIRVGAWEELLLPAPSSGRVELGASNSDTSVDWFVFHKALCPGRPTHNVGQLPSQGRQSRLTNRCLRHERYLPLVSPDGNIHRPESRRLRGEPLQLPECVCLLVIQPQHYVSLS